MGEVDVGGGQAGDFDQVGVFDGGDVCVVLAAQGAEAVQGVAFHFYDPHFGDPVAGVEGEFSAPVVAECAVADLYDQERVLAAGLLFAVTVFAGLQQDEIGLKAVGMRLSADPAINR